MYLDTMLVLVDIYSLLTLYQALVKVLYEFNSVNPQSESMK